MVFNFQTDQKLVMELKLRDTIHEYEKDIVKLISMDNTFHKYFCVLLDSYTQNNDERITKLEKKYENLESIGHHSFYTNDGWYSKDIYCNLNLYKIE